MTANEISLREAIFIIDSDLELKEMKERMRKRHIQQSMKKHEQMRQYMQRKRFLLKEVEK